MSQMHASDMAATRRGFTLVELLVVIGILGVLLSILLPSLAGARSSARAAACQSNIRQLATAWTLYADLNNGAMVAGRMAEDPTSSNIYSVGNGDQYRPRWFAQLGATSGFYAYDVIRDPGGNAVPLGPSTDPALANNRKITNSVFLCPEREEWTNNRNYTYGYNYQFLGNARWRGNNPALGKINYPVRMTLIKTPAATVFAADSLGTAATFAETARLPYNPDGTNNELAALGNHGWALDPPRLTADGDFCDDNHRGEARSAPDPRHNDKANIAYADTHVETQAPREIGYFVAQDESFPIVIPATDYPAHNRHFSLTSADDDPPPVN